MSFEVRHEALSHGQIKDVSIAAATLWFGPALPSRLPSTAVTAGGGQALWSPQDDCLLVRMEAGRGEEDSHGG